jgi:hypothetical protein
MPDPKRKETLASFLTRYMRSGEARKDFPDAKQRYAVANSVYREKGK